MQSAKLNVINMTKKWDDTIEITGLESKRIKYASDYEALIDVIKNIPQVSEEEAAKWNEPAYTGRQIEIMIIEVKEGRRSPKNTPRAYGLQEALQKLAFMYPTTQSHTPSELIAREISAMEPTVQIPRPDEQRKPIPRNPSLAATIEIDPRNPSEN